MNTEQRIRAFAGLGDFIRVFISGAGPGPLQAEYSAKLEEAIMRSQYKNGWFTEASVRQALTAIAADLTEDKLREWTSHYPLGPESLKRVGVIMAGNIPLVGFHDFLCVLVSGNKLIAKLSSDDQYLLPCLYEALVAIEPAFAGRVEFTEGRLELPDAVIATGSNNSARYFDYYFKKYPHIIRRNRNAVAVLDGSETKEELEALGRDVFDYFGLGCRSVSKLYLPVGFDLNRLFEAFYKYASVLEHNKYANNYQYNRTIYLMSQVPLLENGFLLLKEDRQIASPVAVLFYEFYNKPETVKSLLEERKDEIQCIVGHASFIKDAIPFGTAQCPSLSDYADGVDTLEFLTK